MTRVGKIELWTSPEAPKALTIQECLEDDELELRSGSTNYDDQEGGGRQGHDDQDEQTAVPPVEKKRQQQHCYTGKAFPFHVNNNNFVATPEVTHEGNDNVDDPPTPR